jgi:hypothetical protein
MDTLTLVLIFLIGLGIYLLNQSKTKNTKSKAVKKSEIIDSYKKQMKDVLQKNEDDKSKQIQEKIKLLKKINYELSMNLFFDEKEAKELLNELTTLK